MPTSSSQAPRRTFLSGVSVLTLSAVIVKVIGLLYRIPLLAYLGTEGLGYFNTAYEIYALFCVISTAGIPVAMSVLISAREAEGRAEEGERIFRVANTLLFAVGLTGTLILWGFSDPIASLLGSPLSAACIRSVSPTVGLICLSSAVRGYFQGQRQMLPTALSQVIEATGKLIPGLVFAGYARGAGKDLPTTAAYAAMGLTVGTALSLLYLILHRRISDRRGRMRDGQPSVTPAHNGRILRELLKTAVPVTISAGVISLTKCVDLALILRRLQEVGHTAAAANALYGCYSTLAVPIFNVIPSLTTSVALSSVPALSAALGKGREGVGELKRTAASALALTLVVAIPASLGVAVYAEEVLTLLFGGQPDAVALATPWLSCLGLSIPVACLITVTSGMLQAAGKAKYPIASMLMGVVVKTGMAYRLLGRDGWGMAAVPFSSLLCDAVVVAVNLCMIARVSPAMLPSGRASLKMIGGPALLSVAAIALTDLMRRWWGLEEKHALQTVVTILSVVLLYGAGLLIIGLICKQLPIYKKKESHHEQVNSSGAR